MAADGAQLQRLGFNHRQRRLPGTGPQHLFDNTASTRTRTYYTGTRRKRSRSPPGLLLFSAVFTVLVRCPFFVRPPAPCGPQFRLHLPHRVLQDTLFSQPDDHRVPLVQGELGDFTFG